MALLQVNAVSKSFGAIHALTDVSFSLDAGEVVGFMGDNGAGKSTMVKLIAGNFPPSEGEVAVDDEVCHFHKPIDARAKGIEVVYQDLALADNLTAAQNVFLGREIKKGVWPFNILDKQAMIERAAELFSELKSETRPRDLVKKMSGGQRQAVAIARTRLSNAKLVLMDEPTAAISVRQVAEVLELIRRLKAQGRRRHADQPPHARRFCRVRPHHRAAARLKGRRQANRQDKSRGDHRADYGSDPCRLKPQQQHLQQDHAMLSDVVGDQGTDVAAADAFQPGLLGDGGAGRPLCRHGHV